MIAIHLSPAEQVEILREGLNRAKCEKEAFLLREQIAGALQEARDWAASAAELEALLADYPREADFLCSARSQLATAYEAGGAFAKAERVHAEIVEIYLSHRALGGSEGWTGVLRQFAADAEELMDSSLLSAIAGVIRSRMRCEDFEGALRGTEEWRDYLPADRLPINVAVIEILAGRSPDNVPELLPAARACAAEDNYYCFLAGVLLEHAGERRQAVRLLKRFIRTSNAWVRNWGAKEQWERAKAVEILSSGARPLVR